MATAAPAILVHDLTRVFGDKAALAGVSFEVPFGQIHALLGPNGAGKTTLLRILAGLQAPSSGTVEVGGSSASRQLRELQRRIGLVPAGDRSFYLRVSALENLIFYARLHGLRLVAARRRSLEVLERVGLVEVARHPKVGLFSHGMQKRLSVARAFLTEPDVFLVDEATHDLDPEGARRVRSLIEQAARDGAAIVWATQRLDEIRGLAHQVTLIHQGRSEFNGSVEDLASHAVPRHYVVRLRNGHVDAERLGQRLAAALAGLADISPFRGAESDHYLLELGTEAVLGTVITTITQQQVDVLSCRQQDSELEEAFLTLTGARA